MLWWRGSRRPACSAIGRGWRRICACLVHAWTSLSALCGHHWNIRADGRAGADGLGVGLGCGGIGVGTWRLRILAIFLAWPDHLARRVRAARGGELFLAASCCKRLTFSLPWGGGVAAALAMAVEMMPLCSGGPRKQTVSARTLFLQVKTSDFPRWHRTFAVRFGVGEGARRRQDTPLRSP